jgi:hypothetical protein
MDIVVMWLEGCLASRRTNDDDDIPRRVGDERWRRGK